MLRKRIIGTGAFETGDDHIRFTFDGVVNFGRSSAAQNNPWETQLMVTALDDTTNDLFVPAFDYTIV